MNKKLLIGVSLIGICAGTARCLPTQANNGSQSTSVDVQNNRPISDRRLHSKRPLRGP
jgi:hypothetical protein